MRHALPIVLLAALAACGTAATAPPVPCHDGDPAKKTERTMAVTGMAEMLVVPDQAVIQLGFSSTEKQMLPAHEATKKKTAGFLSALQALGVPPTDTSLGAATYTTDRIFPENLPPRIVGFTATMELVVKTKDFTKIPAILDAATAAGLSDLGGVRFESTRLPELKKQVRDLAIKATKDKAQQLAEGLGVKLGPARSIGESSGDTYGYENERMSNMAQRSVSMEDGQLGALKGGSFPIRLSLSVTYELI